MERAGLVPALFSSGRPFPLAWSRTPVKNDCEQAKHEKMHRAALASTALTLITAPVAAQVTLSGQAELGISLGLGETRTGFHHDLDVTFSFVGETDGGLIFGAAIDLAEVGRAFSAVDGSAHLGSIFVSGDFGTVDMGDIDGAFDWALTQASWGTSLADDHSAHAGFNANMGLDQPDLDGTPARIFRYEYAAGDFALALSADLGVHDTLGAGIKYGVDIGATTLIFGIGAQAGDYAFNVPSVFEAPGTQIRLAGKGDIYGASFLADFGTGLSVILNHSRLDARFEQATVIVDGPIVTVTPVTGLNIPIEWTHHAIGVAYERDALLIEANYGAFDTTLAGVAIEADGVGMQLNYDLGTGATAAVGFGAGRAFGEAERRETWSAGLVLSF